MGAYRICRCGGDAAVVRCGGLQRSCSTGQWLHRVLKCAIYLQSNERRNRDLPLCGGLRHQCRCDEILQRHWDW